MNDDKKILVRKARPEHVKAIWQIRNSRLVRDNSKNTEKITFKSHLTWFENKYFIDRRNRCFIIDYSGLAAGYCRFDMLKSGYLVSISIKSAFQGRGLGNILLNKSLKLLKTSKTILAEIKRDNPASLKLFLKNNFEIFRQDKEFFYLKFRQRKNNFTYD